MSRLDMRQLRIADVPRLLENGDLSARDLAEACLARIAQGNPEVSAFLAHDPALVRAQADAIDAGGGRGLLSGVPFAVKDVIDTCDYPTTHGSALYAQARPVRDAACVALSRAQGAILMGKVATGEFATQTPGPARNPLRTTHTPGGSSSGSAAAVAAGMVLAAWGTQTTGSIIRPAVYCGVTGYKPSYGLMNASGCGVLSPLQDTLGVIARTVADVAAFSFGVHGATPDRSLPSPGVLTVGVCRSSQWKWASAESIQAIESTLQRASDAGVRIRDVVLSTEMEALIATQGRIVAHDAGHALAHERRMSPQGLSARLQERMAQGDDIALDEYLAMQRQAAQARAQVESLFQGVDVLAYPATEGEAESGLAHSGSPRFGALWTLLHLPSVAFPTQAGSGGLPLGMQLIGRYADDRRLLSQADLFSGFCQWQP